MDWTLAISSFTLVFRDIDSNPTFKQYVADIQDTIPMVQVESNNGNSVTIGGYNETKETLDIFKFMLNEM